VRFTRTAGYEAGYDGDDDYDDHENDGFFGSPGHFESATGDFGTEG
jgi:hypothetical protein